MNIHTRLVGAFDAIILASTAAVTVMMVVVLLGVSFSPTEMLLGKPGTVTIQQIAADGAVNATASVAANVRSV